MAGKPRRMAGGAACSPARQCRAKWFYALESLARPLLRRARMTLRPPRVRMRDKKPCSLARCRFLGWNVLFMMLFLSGHYSPFITDVVVFWFLCGPAMPCKSIVYRTVVFLVKILCFFFLVFPTLLAGAAEAGQKDVPALPHGAPGRGAQRNAALPGPVSSAENACDSPRQGTFPCGFYCICRRRRPLGYTLCREPTFY